eukprot:scaffold485906_cov33-Prasinocladus_malaysianus.AAC.1
MNKEIIKDLMFAWLAVHNAQKFSTAEPKASVNASSVVSGSTQQSTIRLSWPGRAGVCVGARGPGPAGDRLGRRLIQPCAPHFAAGQE